MRRRSTPYLLLLAAQLLALAGLLIHGAVVRQRSAAELAGMRSLCSRYGLTDLALFTEARYTRHLTQADLHAPFQDHPVSLEHFPTGSLVARPEPSRW